MALTLSSFQQIVSNVATAMQASANAALDFTVGSVFRAIAEATAGVVLWLQAIIIQLLTLTRASTSVGTDLDSWMADYDFERLKASSAAGQLTFSRFTATLQAVIPVGATVRTSDGTQAFTVILDTSNAAYDATLGGYVIAVNTPSVSVPARASTSGAGGNVQSNTITILSTPIQGVDTVSNASAFTGGIDAESDGAFQVRFVLYLASLSKATKTAIRYAVTSVQQGLDCTIAENQDYAGNTVYGMFAVIVDDGTGDPPDDLLASVSNAVDAVRGLTVRFGVFAPVVETANVTMILTTASGYSHSAVVAAVTAALRNFINGLKLGVTLPYTQLAAIAYDVPGVINATGILLNSGTSDLAATDRQKIVAAAMTIS